MTVSADHIVILILLLALTVKFIFFEDKAQLDQLDSMSVVRTGSFFLEASESVRESAGVVLADKQVQTEGVKGEVCGEVDGWTGDTRPLDDCLNIYKSDLGASALSDREVALLVQHRYIPAYQIEKAVGDPERGVGIRRQILGSEGSFTPALADLPYKNYDYSKVSAI